MTVRFLLVLLAASLPNAGCQSNDATPEPVATSLPTVREQTVAKPVAAAAIDPTPYVLLVSFDGMRSDAIGATETPVLDRLIRTGSYQANGFAELPPVTLPNHSSMVTGLSVLHHGVFLNTTLPDRISSTTIFDVAKEAGMGIGFFVTKGKLTFLCPDETATVIKVVGDVDLIADELIKAVAENDLHLVFLHFGEPDGAGHTHGWMSEPYLEQVTRDDAALGRVLDAYGEKGLLDQLLVLVTADHGGHDKTHWMNTPEDRHVPFIFNGPTIAAGRTLYEPRRPMDVAATALDYLGLPLDIARDGVPAKEAYADFQPPPPSEPASLFGVPCGPFPILMIAPMAAFFLAARRPRGR